MEKEGIFVELRFDRTKMESLMQDFYVLTGIRIVLFDEDYHELLAYPSGVPAFCRCMKSSPEARKQCELSDRLSFARCKKEKGLILYRCHAGLIEATAPLMEDGLVIGYLMFGQISDLAQQQELEDLLRDAFSRYQLPQELLAEALVSVPLKSSQQIRAAAKIMEACTYYVILKEALNVRKQEVVHGLKTYLEAHLAEDLCVARLTTELGLSKSKLYQISNAAFGGGIAEYIQHLRIEKAKALLRETNSRITEISEICGFSDYNYFCRVFKRETGMPAKKYRTSFR